MIAIAAVVLAVASEALAVYVASEWLAAGFRPEDRHSIDAPVLVFVALVAFWLPKGVEWLNLGRRASIALTIAVAYVVLYGALRIEFPGDFRLWDVSWAWNFVRDAQDTLKHSGAPLLGAIFVIALWVRSSLRAADDIELDTLPKVIGIPFAAVTVALVLSVYTDRTAEIGRAGATFYATAVLALACSQLALSGATFGELRAGGITATLLGGAAAVTVGAVVVFWITFSVLGPIVGPPLGEVIGNVLFVVLYPFAWVLEQFFRLLLGAGGLPNVFNLTSQLGRANNPQEAAPGAGPSTLEEAGGYAFRFIALVVVLGAIGLGIAWYVGRRSRAKRHTDDSSGGSSGSLRDDGRALLNALLRRKPARPAETSVSEAQRLYLEVLARAEKAGQPRAIGETPEEFAPRLQSAFSAVVTDEITAAFEQARYAGREPDARTLEELRQRWKEAAR